MVGRLMHCMRHVSSTLLVVTVIGHGAHSVEPHSPWPGPRAGSPLTVEPATPWSGMQGGGSRRGIGPRRNVAPQRLSTKPHVDLLINFAPRSAELTAQDGSVLSDLGKALTDSSLTRSRFLIVAHADAGGTRAVIQALAQRRADVIVNYLVTSFGIDRGRLHAVGVTGDAWPLPTPYGTSDAHNQRISIINLGEK